MKRENTHEQYEFESNTKKPKNLASTIETLQQHLLSNSKDTKPPQEEFDIKIKATLTKPSKFLLSRENFHNGREEQILNFNPASKFMEFIAPHELSDKVLTNIQIRYSSSRGIQKDISQSPIIVFSTAKGTGKTRNAMEAVECVKQVVRAELKPYLENKLEFYLMMKRKEMVNGEFKSDAEYGNRLAYLERFLTIRMCYLFATYYLNIEFKEDDWKFQSVEKFVEFLKTDYFESNEKLSIVLVIDEFQKLNSTQIETNTSCIETDLDILLTILGETMLSLNDILLIPIFSGISYSAIVKSFRKVGFPIRFFEPNRLRMSIEDILQFLENFMLFEKDRSIELQLNHSNLLENEELSKCLNLCCGNPKLIETLLMNMKIPSQTWSEIQTKLSESLPKAEYSPHLIDKMFSYHLTRNKVESKNEILESGISFEMLEESGHITLEELETNFIVQPILPFSATVPSTDSDFKDLISKLTRMIEQQGAKHANEIDLELFNASFEVAKCRAHRTLNKKKILFREYFTPAMKPNLVLKNSQLWKESNIE